VFPDSLRVRLWVGNPSAALSSPKTGTFPKYFSRLLRKLVVPQTTILSGRLCLGGCCQWVLDAACQAVEWLHQPLGFNSLTLLVDPLDLDEAA
jgi:hypothetical protein